MATTSINVKNSFISADPNGILIATTTPVLTESDPVWISDKADYFTLADWYATTTDGLIEGLVNKYEDGIHFSTTSADYWISLFSKGYFWSTTSADYWGGTKGYLTAETDPIYSVSSTTILRHGTTSDALSEGSVNLFYKQSYVWDDIWASTTLATTLGKANTALQNLLGGLNAILGNSTTTNATTTTLAITSLGTPAGTFLAVNPNGTVIATSTPAGGSVTSVDMSVPTGLSISGNPITTSGTLALTLTGGYVIPKTASTSEWDTAYGWGNHADAGYLTVESDPVFGASDAAGIVSTDITNWNDAYGWGNHADYGYLTVEADPIYSVSSTSILRYGTTSDALTEGLVNKFYTQAKVWNDMIASTTYQAFINYWTKTGSDLSYTGGVTITGNATTTGYSKLATTTMAYTSKIGASDNYMEVVQDDLKGGGAVGYFPFLKFTNSSGLYPTNFGGFLGGIGIAVDDRYPASSPTLAFMSNDITEIGAGAVGSISFATTSKQMNFDADIFDFGGPVSIGSGGVMGSSYLTIHGDTDMQGGYSYKYNGDDIAFGDTVLNNWFFGNAGNKTTDSLHVTAVGDDALKYLESDANFNTAVGSYAGTGVSFQTQRTHLDRTMTFLGSGASRSHLVPTTTVMFGGTAVGAESEVYENEQVSLGDASLNSVVTWGHLGIGTTSPLAWIDVISSGGDDILHLGSSTNRDAFVVASSGATTINANFEVGVGGITRFNDVVYAEEIIYPSSAIIPFTHDASDLGDTSHWFRQVFASTTFAMFVGIGSDNIEYPLDVTGTIRGTSDLYLTRDDVGPYVGTLGNYDLRLGASSTNSIYIDPQSDTLNHVGIGAADPIQPLHVNGNVRFSRANASGNEIMYLGHDGTFLWEILNDDSSNTFSIGTGSGSLDDMFTINSTGFVGIGTSTPRSTLTVGSVGNSTRQYLQIDSEAGAPAAGDCDADMEDGRMVKDHTNDRLYICNYLSARGWDYIALTD